MRNKLNLSPIAVLLFLVATLSSSVMTAYAADISIDVSMLPAIQQMIEKSPPDDRKRLQQAARVGNKFMRLRLVGEDEYNPEIADKWEKNMAPLMGMTGEEWATMVKPWDSSTPINIPGQKGAVTLLTCTYALLSAVKVTPDKAIEMVYRATLVGEYKGYRRTRSFDKSRAGQPYDFHIEINPAGRIVKVVPSEMTLALAYPYIELIESRYGNKIQGMEAAPVICKSHRSATN